MRRERTQLSILIEERTCLRIASLRASNSHRFHLFSWQLLLFAAFLFYSILFCFHSVYFCFCTPVFSVLVFDNSGKHPPGHDTGFHGIYAGDWNRIAYKAACSVHILGAGNAYQVSVSQALTTFRADSLLSVVNAQRLNLHVRAADNLHNMDSDSSHM